MEHKGITFNVVQTASPSGWKWTAELPGRRSKSGTHSNKLIAVRLAKMAIDKEIRVRQTKPLADGQ